MTWARCSCGSTRFELGFDGPIPMKTASRELTVGPTCLACAQCGKTYLITKDPSTLRSGAPATSGPMISLGGTGETRLDPLLQHVEKNLILQALERSNGNRSNAASLMGLSRSRLYRRMEALGISPGD